MMDLWDICDFGFIFKDYLFMPQIEALSRPLGRFREKESTGSGKMEDGRYFTCRPVIYNRVLRHMDMQNLVGVGCPE